MTTPESNWPSDWMYLSSKDFEVSRTVFQAWGPDRQEYLTIYPDGRVTGSVIEEHPEALAAFQKLGVLIENIYNPNPKALFCPECRDGKTGNCVGKALDPDTDEFVQCSTPTPTTTGETNA